MGLHLEISKIRLARKADGRVQPMGPGLPSAGSHREALPGSQCAHLLVDLARTTPQAPGSHGGVAEQGRQGAEDLQGHDAGTDALGNLCDAADTGGGHEAGQDLA